MNDLPSSNRSNGPPAGEPQRFRFALWQIFLLMTTCAGIFALLSSEGVKDYITLAWNLDGEKVVVVLACLLAFLAGYFVLRGPDLLRRLRWLHRRRRELLVERDALWAQLAREVTRQQAVTAEVDIEESRDEDS